MKEQILDLRRQGLSYRQIEAQLGVSKSLINYYCAPTGKATALSGQRIRRRSIWDEVQEIKTASGCTQCTEKHPACLDFHHKDPSTKLFEVSGRGLTNHSRSAILDEIAKCEVLCANCHRKHHWNERIRD